MKINDEIISLIYGNSVRHINLKLNNQDSKENLLKHIKIYNNLKTVIANCKDDKQIVDLELLYTLVREMKYKLKIGMRSLNREMDIKGPQV